MDTGLTSRRNVLTITIVTYPTCGRNLQQGYLHNERTTPSSLASADSPPDFAHDHVPLQPRHPTHIHAIQIQVVRRVVVSLCEHQLGRRRRAVQVGDSGCVGLDDAMNDGDVCSGTDDSRYVERV